MRALTALLHAVDRNEMLNYRRKQLELKGANMDFAQGLSPREIKFINEDYLDRWREALRQVDALKAQMGMATAPRPPSEKLN